MDRAFPPSPLTVAPLFPRKLKKFPTVAAAHAEWEEECGSFLRMDSDDEKEEELWMSRDTSEILPSLSDNDILRSLYLFSITLEARSLARSWKKVTECCEQVRAVLCGQSVELGGLLIIFHG